MGIFSRNRRKGSDDEPETNHRDFSHVTTVEQAKLAVARGELEPMHLFPPEFGGDDAAVNIVYVPVGFAAVKNQLTGTLIRLFQEGTIDKLTVAPEYKNGGDGAGSVVPRKVAIAATHSTKSGSFKPTIDIW